MSPNPTTSRQKQIIKVKIPRDGNSNKKRTVRQKPKTKNAAQKLKQLKDPKEMQDVMSTQTNLLEVNRSPFANINSEAFAYQQARVFGSLQLFYHTVLKNLASFDSGATSEELAQSVASVFGVCPVTIEPIVNAALSHAAAGHFIECHRGRYVPRNKSYILALNDPEPVPEIRLPREEDAGTLEDILDRTDDWLCIFKESVAMAREKMPTS